MGLARLLLVEHNALLGGQAETIFEKTKLRLFYVGG